MAKNKNEYSRLNWTTEVMVCTKVPHARNPEWQFNLHYLATCAGLVWCLKLWCCLQDMGCERRISQLKYTSVSSMVFLSACDRMCGGLLWFQYNFHPAHTASHETTHAHERKIYQKLPTFHPVLLFKAFSPLILPLARCCETDKPSVATFLLPWM